MEQEKYIEEDEITLKELILTIRSYIDELIRNWKLIFVITIPFIIFFFYKAITTPVVYPASLTFMINQDDGGGLGGMSAILGQFGFGGGGRGKNNLDKILELAKSRNIIHKAVFEEIVIESKADYMANHLIRLYDFHEEWQDDTTGLAGFYFSHDSIPGFDRAALSALKRVYSKVVGSENVNGILKTGYAENSAIMHIDVESISEDLSVELCNLLYSHLSDFYIYKTIEKQKQTFDVMFEKVDSIKQVMSETEYSLAKFLDSNRGLLNNKDRLTELRLQRDVRVLNEAYAASLKNFEIADFTLKNKTPFIQLIDKPFAPLRKVKVSKLRSLLMGGILGVILASLFVIIRKIYKTALQ